METQAILANVLAHRLDAEHRHPSMKSIDQWSEVLTDRLTALLEQMVDTQTEVTRCDASRTAAQLAGLCVRLIEEAGWPLSHPVQPEAI